MFQNASKNLSRLDNEKIGSAKIQLQSLASGGLSNLKMTQTHVKNSNRVDRHVIPGGDTFHFVWKDLVV